MRFLPLLLILPLGLQAQVTGVGAATEIRRENRLRTESLVAVGVDTGTGAFISEQTLLDLPGLTPLNFTLVYNSLLTDRTGVLGPAWSHQFEAFLDGDPEGVVVVHWDATTENRFLFQDGSYEPMEASNRYDLLTQQGSEWRLRLLDGTEYRFDDEGRLTRFANKINQRFNFTYTDEILTKVVEPFSQREINLFYTGGGCLPNPFNPNPCPIRLQHVRDQADRILYFVYNESGALAATRDPVTLSPDVFPAFAPAVILPIPDDDPDGLELNILVDRNDPVGLLFFRSLSITHPRPVDLEIQITSPNGTVGSLTTTRNVPDWNLAQVSVDFFDGEDPSGTWTIRIIDDRSGEVGDLSSYGFSFTEPTNPFPITYNNRQQIISIEDPDGNFVVSQGYDNHGRRQRTQKIHFHFSGRGLGNHSRIRLGHGDGPGVPRRAREA